MRDYIKQYNEQLQQILKQIEGEEAKKQSSDS